MITSQTFRFNRVATPVSVSRGSGNSDELSRVFSAAVVNEQFRDMLLQNPHEALRSGYQGAAFDLSKEEQDLIVSIRASSLSDLAKQVSRILGF